MSEKEKDKIKNSERAKALLSEYQACHRNRNHYDSVRWTIGSIFIATSLALFGVSFWKEIIDEPQKVLLVAIFSGALIATWYLYNRHVNPYVMASVVRFHEIEKELRRMGYSINLHRSIATTRKMRGIWVTYLLFMVVCGASVFRLVFFYWPGECALYVYGVLMIITAIIVYLQRYKESVDSI